MRLYFLRSVLWRSFSSFLSETTLVLSIYTGILVEVLCFSMIVSSLGFFLTQISCITKILFRWKFFVDTRCRSLLIYFISAKASVRTFGQNSLLLDGTR